HDGRDRRRGLAGQVRIPRTAESRYAKACGGGADDQTDRGGLGPQILARGRALYRRRRAKALSTGCNGEQKVSADCLTGSLKVPNALPDATKSNTYELLILTSCYHVEQSY